MPLRPAWAANMTPAQVRAPKPSAGGLRAAQSNRSAPQEWLAKLGVKLNRRSKLLNQASAIKTVFR